MTDGTGAEGEVPANPLGSVEGDAGSDEPAGGPRLSEDVGPAQPATIATASRLVQKSRIPTGR